MSMKTLATRAAIGLLVLASACGDDSSKSEDTGDSSLPGAGGKLSDGGTSVIHADAGLEMDAKVVFDGALLPDGDDGAVGDAGSDETADGTVGESNMDAAQADATTTQGADAATTADATSSSTPDASDVADSSVADASLADASATDADAGDAGDAGDCSINDPRFGCGTAISATWVRFTSGLEYDRVSGLGWTPVRTPLGATPDTENQEYCKALTFAGIGNAVWDVPEIDEVRTLAAGCDKTELGGSCPVDQMHVDPVAAGVCSCDGQTDSHASTGFCRVELSSCDTLWTRTWCGPDSVACPSYEHWFYDVIDGSITLRPYTSVPANVKGRCVTKIVPALP